LPARATEVRNLGRVPYDAVLFDFSGTLFHIESAADAVAATLGPDAARFVSDLERFGAINGSRTPAELPDHLAGCGSGATSHTTRIGRPIPGWACMPG
jgi:hypothetical protein